MSLYHSDHVACARFKNNSVSFVSGGRGQRAGEFPLGTGELTPPHTGGHLVAVQKRSQVDQMLYVMSGGPLLSQMGMCTAI